MPNGWERPVFVIGEVTAVVVTKSGCPMTKSAEGPLAPAVKDVAEKRRTRLLPRSVTQRLPSPSKASPTRPPASDNVLAFTPPLFAPFDEKDVWPMIIFGN